MFHKGKICSSNGSFRSTALWRCRWPNWANVWEKIKMRTSMTSLPNSGKGWKILQLKTDLQQRWIRNTRIGLKQVGMHKYSTHCIRRIYSANINFSFSYSLKWMFSKVWFPIHFISKFNQAGPPKLEDKQGSGSASPCCDLMIVRKMKWKDCFSGC